MSQEREFSVSVSTVKGACCAVDLLKEFFTVVLWNTKMTEEKSLFDPVTDCFQSRSQRLLSFWSASRITNLLEESVKRTSLIGR